MFIVVLCGLISILPPGIFYVSFFAFLMVSGICGIYYDNCPSKLEDGQEYCSPSLNSMGKGIEN